MSGEQPVADFAGVAGDLLAILADPGDKGPVEPYTDADGRPWLVNRRNGNRYPIADGIPVMLLDEGERHRDPALVSGEVGEPE